MAHADPNRKSPVLAKLSPARLYPEVGASDARRLGIRSGDPVRVVSKRGRLRAWAFVTPCIRPAYKASAVAIHPLESCEA